MRIMIICDKDKKTECINDLKDQLVQLFLFKKFDVKVIEVGKQNLKSCIGCFGCWLKTPGKCVIKDSIDEINTNYLNSDIVFFLTPVIFGQHSYNIKNVIDRSQPFKLPFFKKVNGTTKHPLRYKKNPTEIFIGYSDDITDEEKATFFDLINKHGRQHRDVFLSLSKTQNKEIVNRIEKIV